MVGLAAVVIILLLVFINRSKSKDSGSSKKIIYGRMSCPYTVKQVEKYPDAEFVDCGTPGACPEFVTAFPTTKNEDGSIVVGFA
jgi:hypothetical protein